MIYVNCQSSINIVGSKVIYFDPINLGEDCEKADYIFITHTHWDHFSMEDILKIKSEHTKLIGPMDMEEKLKEIVFPKENLFLVIPNQTFSIDDLNIKTVPAYNLNKEFHKKDNKWLGYVIEFENTTYYIPGDTDVLEENKNIKCDIAFIPIGGTYTMTSEEASGYINYIKPKKVIPIHYNMVVGTKEDEKNFISNIDSDIEIEILI